MTENTNTEAKNTTPPVAKEAVSKVVEKYPAMRFVSQFARLVATIMAFAFVGIALVLIIMGIFTEASFVLSLVNAGFYLLIGSVCVGLVRGAGEVFELLLELEKRR